MLVSVHKLLTAHPLAACLALLLAIVALSALLVLPRLDAVEIRGGQLRSSGGAATLDLRLGYRLASAGSGELRLRAQPAGGGPARLESRTLRGGRAELEASLALPPAGGAGWIVFVELVPAAPAEGWLGRLAQSRRRDLRRFAEPATSP